MPNRRSSDVDRTADAVYLPASFFTEALPRILDLTELKAVLCVAYLIHQRQGARLPDAIGITYRELKDECRRSLPETGEDALRRALDAAVKHGALLRSSVRIDGVFEEAYSLAPAMGQGDEQAVNIFVLYEQNIGIITPMIAEELKEAEKLYPPEWVEDALKEAVVLNRRSWKYISRILERWASEGKESGEHKGHTKKTDPDKYIKGKYGHLVRR
jgi:DNA replication protein